MSNAQNMKTFDKINETDANGNNGLARVGESMFLCWMETVEDAHDVQTFVGLSALELQTLRLWFSDKKEGSFVTIDRLVAVHFKKL